MNGHSHVSVKHYLQKQALAQGLWCAHSWSRGSKSSQCLSEETGATERTGGLKSPGIRPNYLICKPKGDVGPGATQQTPIKDQT